MNHTHIKIIEKDGQPYGRPINPFIEPTENSTISECSQWANFDLWAKQNATLPFPSGTIGRTYERGEVEVVWQVIDSYFCGEDKSLQWTKGWVDRRGKLKHVQPSESSKLVYTYRQIFRLVISKTETTTPPVDHSKSSDSCNQTDLLSENDKKQPELTPEQYFEITGFHTPEERRAYEEGFEAKEKVMIEFIEKWDGSTNSGLGELLDRKFKEWLPNQP